MRPEADEARIVGASPMWSEFDVARIYWSLAHLYSSQGDWAHASEADDRAVKYYKELVEQNPSVATFTLQMMSLFADRNEAAEKSNDRQHLATWSKDAVAFWNRQLDLHPDLAGLHEYANYATKMDADITHRLAHAASTQASSTQP